MRLAKHLVPGLYIRLSALGLPANDAYCMGSREISCHGVREYSGAEACINMIDIVFWPGLCSKERYMRILMMPKGLKETVPTGNR